jgi:hypothetical protein
MTVPSARMKFALKLISPVIAGAAAVAILPVSPALAIGNTRDVSRSCGVNNVASGYNGSNGAWAQTSKISGNCSGQLGVSLKTNAGYVYPRVNGDRFSAYISKTASGGFSQGLHWGCLDCNVTYS